MGLFDIRLSIFNMVILPTIMTLRQLSGFDSVTALLSALGQAPDRKNQ